MVSITYLQKEIMSQDCGEAQGLRISEHRLISSFTNTKMSRSLNLNVATPSVNLWGFLYPLHK